MIVGVISRDSQYKEFLEADENIELAILFENLQEEYQTNVALQALLCDGKVVPISELPRLRDIFPEIPIFYKYHNVESGLLLKNVERICAAYKIIPINEYLNANQVVQKVITELFHKEDFASKRIVSFFGTHSNAGVSTTVLNLARTLSERIQEKVLVLSLNAWDPADYFYDYQGLYLNDLKVDLEMRKLAASKLNNAVAQYKAFYHLAGNRDIKAQRFYTSEEIEHLINVAQEVFDLILIDGGTHFDNACAAQAYVSSNLRFIIATQEDKGYRGYFPHVLQQLIEPSGGSKDDFMLIINKFQPNMSLINEKDLENELEMQKIATIPYMDVLGNISIRQQKLLYDIADDTYKKPLQTISNLIIAEAKLHEKPIVTSMEQHTQSRKFFSLFSKNKKVGVD